MDFESKLKRLEEIVNILESGECSFDDATILFEEGKDIAINCSNKLNENKGKIVELVNQLDKVIEKEIE